MRFLFLVQALLFLLTSQTIAQQVSNDREQLRYLKEVEWPKAYYDQDTLLLDRILGDEFQLINANGNSFSKQDELAYITKNKPSYKSFNFEITRLDILENNTAIVAGKGTIVNTDEQGEHKTTTYWSSNILIKRGNLWKAVSSHVSGIKIEE